MKTKFTPGPWKVDESDDFGYDIINPRATFGIEYIAKEICQGADDGKADAHLIAAAPDLLAACMKAISQDSNYITEDAILMCKMAIKKAEGTTP